MRRLRNFLKMGMSSRILLLVAFILLAAIRLGLLMLPFHQLFKLLTSISKSFKPKIATRVTIGQIIWAINVVTRYMPGGAKCLARALTTKILMNWCGYQPEIRIGVAKGETGIFEAHAWIEYKGRVVIGYLQDLPRFVPLPSLEGVKI
jgi:Transglutaminase-like superfamily